MIKFNAKLLAAVAIAQSTDAHRYYLNGVQFEDGLAIATDGKLLTVARDVNADQTGKGLYPVSKAAQAAMKKAKADTVTIENGLLEVLDVNSNSFYTERVEEIDGTFPIWRRVVPAKDIIPTTASFMVADMVKVNQTAKMLGSDHTNIVATTGSYDPHTVYYSGQHYIMSVIMPILESRTGVAPDATYINIMTVEG